VKSIPNLLETLQGLRNLGCRYRSTISVPAILARLHQALPADRIKIDQTFVRNIGVDPDDEAIVRATISMAHNLNRAVVAEGVEIEEHLIFCERKVAKELQGYLFAVPCRGSFENLLAERERIFHGTQSTEATP